MQNSLLAKLPPELRNDIFKEVLVSREPIYVYQPNDLHFEDRWTAPALPQVCQQLRQEAMSIYYGLNVFKIPGHGDQADSVRSLCAWLTLLGTQVASFLRIVRLDDCSYWVEQVENRIASLRCELERLRIPMRKAKLEVELWSEHPPGNGGQSGVWLSSADDGILSDRPLDVLRRDKARAGTRF